MHQGVNSIRNHIIVHGDAHIASLKKKCTTTIDALSVILCSYIQRARVVIQSVPYVLALDGIGFWEEASLWPKCDFKKDTNYMHNAHIHILTHRRPLTMYVREKAATSLQWHGIDGIATIESSNKRAIGIW